MKYRVRLDLSFDTEEMPQSIFKKAKLILSKAVKLSEQEPSFIEIQKCYHDEVLAKKCEIIERIEV